MQKLTVFEPVLIRNSKHDRWTADFYDYPNDNSEEHWTVAGSLVSDSNILPYNEETKHLHNTVGEFTKWKPKKGEAILVKDVEDTRWNIRIFLSMEDERYACTTDPATVYCPHSCTTWDCAKPYISPFKE